MKKEDLEKLNVALDLVGFQIEGFAPVRGSDHGIDCDPLSGNGYLTGDFLLRVSKIPIRTGTQQ